MKNPFAAMVGAVLIAIAMSTAANAGSLRQGSTAGAQVTGSLPGQVLWASYQTLAVRESELCPPDGNPDGICNTLSIGDNILRLINPNGSANPFLAGGIEQPVCAMIYVFDDDEEMGECCGCPLSSTRLATFSVIYNLTSNWELSGPEGGISDFNAFGAIAVVAAAPDTAGCIGAGGGNACNGGCDPTNVPGYNVTVANNLLGSMTHNQAVVTHFINSTSALALLGLTEVPLSDDGGGDPSNLSYLQNQCGALVGNGTGGGICNCPIE